MFMKPICYFFLPFLLLLPACGTFEVSIDSTPAPNTLPIPLQPVPAADTGELGTVYFWMSKPAGEPADPSLRTGSLARLPGTCVAGLTTCPPPEELKTPFEISDVSWQPMVWSPDGKMAALPVAMTDDVLPMTVYVYRPEDEMWIEIANFPVVDGISWSPDGAWLSLRVQDGFGDTNVFAMRPDGSGQRNLTGENLPDKGEPAFLAMSGWLEGKALVATRGIIDELTTFHQVDPATGETKLLFTYPTYPGGIYPAPDSTLLAVGVSPTQKQTLEIIHPDGEVKETLATFSNGGMYIVSWSHDMKKIAFTVQEYDQNMMPAKHRAFVVNRDGSGLTELYSGPDYTIIPSLSFSPDDKYLLVYEAGQSVLVSVSLDTLEQTVIFPRGTEADVFFLYPSWQQ